MDRFRALAILAVFLTFFGPPILGRLAAIFPSVGRILWYDVRRIAGLHPSDVDPRWRMAPAVAFVDQDARSPADAGRLHRVRQPRGMLYVRSSTLVGPEAAVRYDDISMGGRLQSFLYFAFVRIPRSLLQWRRWLSMWLGAAERNVAADTYVSRAAGLMVERDDSIAQRLDQLRIPDVRIPRREMGDAYTSVVDPLNNRWYRRIAARQYQLSTPYSHP